MINRHAATLLSITTLLAVSAPLHAQHDRLKSSGAMTAAVSKNVMRKFGPITSIDGAQAKARNSSTEIGFGLPAAVQDKVKVGQPVWATLDLKAASFVGFPIEVPKAKNCVGHGPGNGCFRMETSDVLVSNNGLVSGKTHIISEDFIEGFTGAVWIRLYDREGNPIAVERGGCYGVNLRQGRTEIWKLTLPTETAVQAYRAQIYHVKSPCSRDRWEDVMEKAEKGAEVAGKIVEVYTAAKGAK